MGEHKLNLSEETRTKIKARVNRVNREPTSMPPKIYLKPGESNIGRNRAKREKRSAQKMRGR